MTKSKLKELAEQYIELQSKIKDEWYISDKGMSQHILSDFLSQMCNIILEEPKDGDPHV